MNVFFVCFLLSFVSCAHLEEYQSNVEDIQQLLKELEKLDINNNISNNKDNKNQINSTLVRNALTGLSTSLQQISISYIGVLTRLAKSLTISGLHSDVQFMQSSDAPIVIKQISENIRQLQDSLQEMFRTASKTMQKFMRLWTKQIQEVSEQITHAFGGLEADVNDGQLSPLSNPLTELVDNLIKIFDKTVDKISQSLIGGQHTLTTESTEQKSIPNIRDEPKPSSNSDILTEFKNMLEIIIKSIRIFNQQLESQLSGKPTENLKAEHKEIIFNPLFN